ncbi:hypothetical protein SAMN05877753_101410 [Bacillus oleivorans]|uniref:Uncharacterized protein n=1 Tax=Bacillus oleivorans TaxID=1448271 RepID=A0A285CIC0_9BACI|nr:hypothetical protein [Bacillus oleivorans]SNX67095.1 hypothetical protein SAMN05877753_101410 [Bacillus oleivorans]
MIDTSMILKLYELNIRINEGKKNISRKEIKIVVDSLIEQIYQYYFESKPNGILNIRQKINNELDSLQNEEDKILLRSLGSILREYNSAFSKDYIDHSSSFNTFLNNELKNLSLALVKHSYFSNDEHAKSLKGLLE